MSNDTITSSSSVAATPLSPTLGEEAGVRKVLEAYAEREVQKVRWSAVIAGLFLAGGTKILLLLLGDALGLTPAPAHASGPLPGLNAGFSAFTLVVGLLASFVGGYAAAKLSGSIRRADGVLAGILTWATSLVFAVLIALHLDRVDLIDATALRAWLSFGGVFLSLLTAMLGGARGSVQGGKLIPGDIGARRRELRRRAREQEKKEEAQRRSAL